jgi:NitT/TauT family transport system ATP-binding protein
MVTTTSPDNDTSGDDRRSIAALAGVSKVYRAARAPLLALKGVDLEVGASEFVTVVGASGCGKSTMLGLLAGLLTPTEGRVERMQDVVARGGTGMVFQNPVLLPWRSVLANVLLPAEILHDRDVRARALELIQHVGLGGFERARPHELSGGMQQRVSICRALLTRPRLLLMDEPFGALDAITRELMNALMQQVWLESACSVVLVTHNIEEAIFLADRIVIMTPRPGRIAEVIENRLPRPRDTGTYRHPLFTEYADRIRRRIVVQAQAA